MTGRIGETMATHARRRAPAKRVYPVVPPSHRLDHADVLDRVKDHGPTHYAGLYNVMKGVTLAGGGIALVNLADAGMSLSRLALVAVAFIGVLLTYYGQTAGLVIVHLRPSIMDISLPMALTVAEFYIMARPGSGLDEGLPLDWFVGLALWALLAASVVASIAGRLDRSSYSSKLWPVVEDYRSELWRDVRAACALAAGTVVFVVLRGGELDDPTALEYAFLAAVGGVLCRGIWSQGQARRMLAKRLGLPI
jgi:hypothetical protein